MYYTIYNGSILTAKNTQLLSKFYNWVKPLPLDYEDGKYIIKNNKLILNENYEAEKELKEKNRVAQLYLTGADVERGIYKAKGMDFEDIVNFITNNPQDGLDIKALKIELKANHFYRGNPYVSAIGQLLGFSDKQLDLFFETGNYEFLIKEENEANI